MLKLVAFPEPHKDTTKGGYITLSHCWGEKGVNKECLLMEENIQHRTDTGWYLRELPKTFQDAVEISGWFKVRWLWIDCLCIIQNSSGGEDWHREADLMGKVYENALLNISAEVGSDSGAGCFVERHAVSLLRPQVVVNDQYWIISHPFELMSFGQAHSFSRAWIYRERQLSRRILHFTYEEIIWECCVDSKVPLLSESFPEGPPGFLLSLMGNEKFKGIQRGSMEPNRIYYEWRSLCERFSSTNLIKYSDMPFILSILADEFSRSLPPDQYVSGHWQSRLPKDLFWHKERPGNKQQTEPIAPSWSWLAYEGITRLARGRTLPESWDDPIPVDIVDVATFGPVNRAVLTLKGFIRHVHLKIRYGVEENSGLKDPCIIEALDGIPWEAYYDRLNQERPQRHRNTFKMLRKLQDLSVARRVIYEPHPPPDDLDFSQAFLDCHHEGIEREDGECIELNCFILLVHHECLLLHELNPEIDSEVGPNTYKRLGMVRLISTDALKLRYSAECLPTRDDKVEESLGSAGSEPNDREDDDDSELVDYSNYLPRCKFDSDDEGDLSWRLYGHDAWVERFFEKRGLPCPGKLSPRMIKLV
ncbi:hypothetical protein CHU98_g1065 [Xylaria longipes]|nr:hypothetical protein CHU98_g1065 [Xylaria longipes]